MSRYAPAKCVYMRYLIDGYNLLHAMGVLLGRVGPHGLEKARLALLGRLIALHGDEIGQVTVVFDARNAPPGAAPQDEYRGVHILYALHEEADDVIEALIHKETAPRQLTVVSDDHRLKEAARRGRCLAVGCLDYLELARRPAPTPPSADGSAKPQGVSAEEARRWLAEFGDLADDPKLRGWVEMDWPADGD